VSQETTDNFWAAFNAWEPDPPKPVFFRLYYNESGNPTFYTMEDLPGNYIEIDAATFARASPTVRVVNGKLVELPRQQITKLVPVSDSIDGVACDPRNVAVVVDNTQPLVPYTKWSLKTYETS
jgi:hypothetical protein